MKVCFRIFVLLSFICLALWLYRADYLRLPEILSPLNLTASLVFLFAAFLVSALCWKGVLETAHFDVPARDCIAGMGLSVFGKYIPGKIWTIAGRAAYVAQGTKYSLAELSVFSLRTQFLDLWTGLSLGTVGLCVVGGLKIWGSAVVVLWLLLTGLIFSRAVQKIATAAGRVALRKQVRIPSIDVRATVGILPRFALSWGLWTVAFFLFARGILAGYVPWTVGFGFPLAASLGIMAIIAPGGLGVREGVLTGYLVLAGIPVADATTVAVASRLWFLIGEVFIFVVGALTGRSLKRLGTACQPDRMCNRAGSEEDPLKEETCRT